MSQHSPGEIKAEFTPRYGGPEEFIFLLWIVFCEGGGGGGYYFLWYSRLLFTSILLPLAMWERINQHTLDPGLEVLNVISTDFKYMPIR